MYFSMFSPKCLELAQKVTLHLIAQHTCSWTITGNGNQRSDVVRNEGNDTIKKLRLLDVAGRVYILLFLFKLYD